MILPEGTPSLYRKMPGKPISQRIFHNGEHVIGFNMLGSRWNHELLVRWIEEKQSLDFVRKNLHRAQYDVEFGRAQSGGRAGVLERLAPCHGPLFDDDSRTASGRGRER